MWIPAEKGPYHGWVTVDPQESPTPIDRSDKGGKSLRALTLAVYVPIVIFAIGEGAVIPFIVLGAIELGASASLAGAIFALQGVSALVFAIPAGRLIGAFGSRRAAVVSVIVTVAGLGGAALGTTVFVYATSIFVIGVGWSIWRLVRFEFLVGAVDADKRGRALAVMGGSQRMGKFVGPLLAAAATLSFGLGGAFYIHMVVAVVALVVFVSVPLTESAKAPKRERVKLRGLGGNRRTFVNGSVVLVILIVVRAARPLVVPLWAIHIGLDAATVGLIFGLSSGIDAVMFYPAGIVMDRFGRKWVAIPSITVLALSFFLLPLAQSFASLLAVALLMGLGNGLGSGYGATLGSDLAPKTGRAEFLGMWQMVANLGNIAGPLMLGGVLTVASLGTASFAVGAIGVLGLAQIAWLVPETRPNSLN